MNNNYKEIQIISVVLRFTHSSSFSSELLRMRRNLSGYETIGMMKLIL